MAEMFERWLIEGHELIDVVDGKRFQSKDQAFVHVFNVIYNELQEIKKEK